MKIYNNIEDIKKLAKSSKNFIYDEDDTKFKSHSSLKNDYSIDEFDKLKTKILKYVLYKKRSKNEVIRKFKNECDQNMLEDIIANLEENGYINDNEYIRKSVNEFVAIRNLSMFEIKYKLISKGINPNDIDDFFNENYDELLEYEKKSAKNIVNKKINSMDSLSLKNYLLKKGYKEESIKEAM